MVYDTPDRIEAVKESEIDEDENHNVIHNHDDYEDYSDSDKESSSLDYSNKAEEPTIEMIEDIVDPESGFH